MKALLITLFAAILLTMLTVTGQASLSESLFKIPPQVTGDPWFIATLFDAYCGFVTFYVWVFYKEKSILVRSIWFVLIMALGNIAMASYVLIKLFKLPQNSTLRDLVAH